MAPTKLVKTLREKSVLRTTPDKPFTLASGGTSLIYVDIRLTALDSDGIYILARCLCSELFKMPVTTLVAGVVVGGCPLATAVSIYSKRDALYVRKEAKDHGTGKLVEGSYQQGDSVVLLEDVVTSGSSSLGAVQTLRDAGLDVKAVLAVLDREEGGRARIEAAGIEFRSLVTLGQLLAE